MASSSQRGDNSAEPLPVENPSQRGLASSNKTQARSRKKARLDPEDTQGDCVHISTPSERGDPHILKLPLEILGECLILTGSPQHILAFARTSKHFCYTLIGDGAQYIWRRARCGTQCSFTVKYGGHGPFHVISLPDPPKHVFSEAAYAAFLFDPGVCDNCGKQTSASYASFALRIRFCTKPPCRRLPTGLHEPEQFELIVPTNEISNILATHETNVTYWPYLPTSSHVSYSHANDISKAREVFLSENGDGNEEKLESLRKRNHEWMEFCSSLAKWKAASNEKLRRVTEGNKQVARQVANNFGWEYTDLIGCTVFGLFCKQKSRLLESVFIDDVCPLRDQIELELFPLEEKRQRRTTEKALMRNREDVEALYHRLRSKKAYRYPPSLPTFRQLPIIQLLQDGIYESGTKISDTLQNNSLMRQQLDQDVKRWIETAKRNLVVLLGYPREWKSLNKSILHPVERATAWFLCTKCGAADGTNYKTGGCLDFAAACLHVCQTKDGKNERFRKSKKAAWNPGNFIKDEKASNVMKSALTQLGSSDETVGSLHLKSGLPFLCTSCEPFMVLDSRNIVQHCHRHDSMQISPLSHNAAMHYLNGFPYSYGLVTKLLKQGGQAIQGEIGKKNFGCRICSRKRVKDGLGSTDCTPDDFRYVTPLQSCNPLKPKELPPLFNFNGMRSHLKAKHGIENICDEDFFCSDPLPL